MNEPTVSPDFFPGRYKPIKLDDLPWEEKATLMWSWYWRALIIGLLTVWLGGFTGGLLSMYIRLAVGELDPTVSESIGYILGIIIGFFGVHPTIKLLTKWKLGEYQIVILKKQPSEQNSGAA